VCCRLQVAPSVEVTAGLTESKGSLLPGLWRDSLHVTCGLNACTPGSAPGPTLGNEHGKTLPFMHCNTVGTSDHGIKQDQACHYTVIPHSMRRLPKTAEDPLRQPVESRMSKLFTATAIYVIAVNKYSDPVVVLLTKSLIACQPGNARQSRCRKRNRKRR